MIRGLSIWGQSVGLLGELLHFMLVLLTHRVTVVLAGPSQGKRGDTHVFHVLIKQMSIYIQTNHVFVRPCFKGTQLCILPIFPSLPLCCLFYSGWKFGLERRCVKFDEKRQ